MRRGFVQTLFVILIGILLGGLMYYQQSDLEKDERGLFEHLQALEDIVQSETEETPTTVADVSQELVPAEPLRGPVVETQTAQLSSSGILLWTNIQRAKFGLLPLSLKTQLNAAALLKVQDMFEQQYFAHESPQGDSAGDLAKKVIYKYILIGENLALGNYENDEGLVQAWMDSPGHRDNILNDRFTEIGIAVLEGTFEGHKTWLAVQEFGLPLSACPSPDEDLAEEIDNNKAELDNLSGELEARADELAGTTPTYGSVYNKKVKEYNNLVAIYNDLVKKTRALVETYNEEIGVFNVCATNES